MALSTLTTLKTLELCFWFDGYILTSVDTLTALQTLDVSYCKYLQDFPPLDALTALQTLILVIFVTSTSHHLCTTLQH
jgi:hypothetical protein